MDTINKSSLPAIGAPLLGGFYAGLFNLGNQLQALIVSPKAQGQFAPAPWGEYGQLIDATSCFDGHANTHAMAATGNKTAASYSPKRNLCRHTPLTFGAQVAG